MANHFDCACGFGANRLDDVSVRFRLPVSARRTVTVTIGSGGPLPMRGCSGGRFETKMAVPDGTRYRYSLPDGPMVPDPAGGLRNDLPRVKELGFEMIGSKAVLARWKPRDRSHLTIVTNLGADAVPYDAPAAHLPFVTDDTAPITAWYLERAA